VRHLSWIDRSAVPDRSPASADTTPPARRVLVAAFEGWNDAGDAATGAVEHLWESWSAVTVAAIDPEEFHDFTVARPQVRLDDDGSRVVDWPTHEFGWARPPGTDGVLLLRGLEPQLRWRTYCDEVIGVARELGCDLVITVGALLADVPHTRATPVIGTVLDEQLMTTLGLQQSSYEGPTGIVGVLHGQCRHAGVDSASLWAAVPAYVPAAPSPKATLALVHRLCALIGTTASTTVLEVESVSYERQMSDLVADDEDTVEYVNRLESEHDAEAALESADDLVDEVERFLREQ
jgi:proteasome assembly chaperone (PAC2) family protein